MNITLSSIANQSVSFLKEQILPALSAQQRKIIAIAALALGCLALCYVVLSRYCLKSRLSSSASTEWDFRAVPPNTPPRIPEDYEWVKGASATGRFLASKPSADLLAVMAKASYSYQSPEMGRDSILYIGDLVYYSSVSQFETIVKEVSDNLFHVRAIFNSLFREINSNPSGDGKVRAKRAVELLSPGQLMYTLALQERKKDDTFYQFEYREIQGIPLDFYLKYQSDLNLPPEFIATCQRLAKYEKHVQFEAKKEAKEKGQVIIE